MCHKSSTWVYMPHSVMQVPPALPALPCCWLAARWHGALFVIDWHNFAYSIMGLSLGPRHFLVRPAGLLHAVHAMH